MVKTGVAFGDSIFQDSEKRKSYNYQDKENSGRNYFLPLFFILLFLILLVRLFFVQIIRGYYYRDLSNTNRTKTVVVHAPRGIIFDRNGVPLVFNAPGFRQIENGKTKLLTSDVALFASAL